MIAFIYDEEIGKPLSEPQKLYAYRMYQGEKPKFHKGKYGKKYDNYTCGNCGAGLKDIVDDFCWSCGFRILWDNPRCLTDKEGEYNESKHT